MKHYLVCFVAGAALFLADSPRAGAETAGNPTWKALGHRWALEMDSDGKALRVFDLSYPGLFGGLSLGKISPELDLRKLKKVISNAAKTDQEKEKAREAIAVIKELSSRGFKTGTFPEQWWREVSWKNQFIGRAPDAPASFRLSDVDWAASSENGEKFEAKFEEVETRFARVFGPGTSFLQGLRFHRAADGSYEIFLESAASRSVSPGRRVVDLDSTMAGFWDASELELLSDAIGGLLSLIPVPVLSAFLATAVDRYFHAYKLMISTEQELVLEMTEQAQDRASFSPFSKMDAEQRKAAVKYVYWSETSILGALKWIFKSPFSQWEDDVELEKKRAGANLVWISDQMSAQSLNNRFVSGKSARTSGLFLVATDSWDLEGIITPAGEPPVLAVDDRHPGRIAAQRELLDLLATTVDFFTRLIPNGSILNSGFSALVEENVDRLKRWEGRLSAHLKERERAGETWSREIQELEKQRVNFLELSGQDSENLIQLRKQQLGIQSSDQ